MEVMWISKLANLHSTATAEFDSGELARIKFRSISAV